MLEPGEAYRLWAPSYASNPLMRAEERAMLACLPPLRDGAVLDAACGTGRYLRHAHARGARLAAGVDLVAAMLRRAPGPCLVQARLEALPFRLESFDLTICALALGYVEDLDGAVAELARVTRPGGRVLCSDLHPAGRSLGWRREFKLQGERFAIRHSWHELADWTRAGRRAGLQLDAVLEPPLLPQDLLEGPPLDPQTPVALVLGFQRPE